MQAHDVLWKSGHDCVKLEMTTVNWGVFTQGGVKLHKI
jgi:hypothetical protein